MDPNHPTRETLIAPGDEAPDFVLPDQDRTDWRLADAAARGTVLLAFYPFAFTGVCGTEAACLTDHLADLHAAGHEVVGISTDSPAANKAWAEREGYRHRLLSDLHRSVVRAYGLHWAELNVSRRGTVILERTEPGHPIRVRWSESREPGQAMDWDAVRSHLA